MTKSRKTNTQGNHNRNTPPTASHGEAQTNINIQNTEPGQEPENNTQSQPSIYRRLAKFVRNKDNQPIVANVISLLMFLATVCLAFYTVALFSKTSIQAEQSIKSADAAIASNKIAQDALATSKKYNDNMRKVQKISDSIQNKKDSITHNLQDSALNTQIASLNEAQKEFTIANEPYLQIADVKIDTFIVGKPIMMSSIIENMGNYPVKIINAVGITAIRVTNPGVADSVLNDTKHTSIISLYVVKGGGQPLFSYIDRPLSNNQYELVTHSNYYVGLPGLSNLGI